SFSGCKIDKAGAGYVLTASDGTRSVDSAAFTVSVGAVSQLGFTTHPDGAATRGVPVPTQPVVTAADAGGNTVTSYSSSITLSIKSWTGARGPRWTTFFPYTTLFRSSFSGCKIDKAGAGYVLTASDGTRSVDSAAFPVSVGPVTQLVFTTQPDGAAASTATSPQQPAATASYAGGNTDTGYASTMSLPTTSGPGT